MMGGRSVKSYTCKRGGGGGGGGEVGEREETIDGIEGVSMKSYMFCIP